MIRIKNGIGAITMLNGAPPPPPPPPPRRLYFLSTYLVTPSPCLPLTSFLNDPLRHFLTMTWRLDKVPSSKYVRKFFQKKKTFLTSWYAHIPLRDITDMQGISGTHRRTANQKLIVKMSQYSFTVEYWIFLDFWVGLSNQNLVLFTRFI